MSKELRADEKENLELYRKVQGEAGQKYYDLIRLLLATSITLSGGLLAFIDFEKMNFNERVVFTITLLSLLLGALFSAILLYGGVHVLLKTQTYLREYINMSLEEQIAHGEILENERPDWLKTVDFLCFSCYIIFILSIMTYTIFKLWM